MGLSGWGRSTGCSRVGGLRDDHLKPRFQISSGRGLPHTLQRSPAQFPECDCILEFASGGMNPSHRALEYNLYFRTRIIQTRSGQWNRQQLQFNASTGLLRAEC
jgi:hypothetical protein